MSYLGRPRSERQKATYEIRDEDLRIVFQSHMGVRYRSRERDQRRGVVKVKGVRRGGDELSIARVVLQNRWPLPSA